MKVGIPEFLNGVGKDLGKHAEKLEAAIGGLDKLLITRTIKLKRIGIPCQDVSRFSLFIVVDVCVNFRFFSVLSLIRAKNRWF